MDWIWAVSTTGIGVISSLGLQHPGCWRVRLTEPGALRQVHAEEGGGDSLLLAELRVRDPGTLRRQLGDSRVTRCWARERLGAER